ncbi:hypothetical protein SAMN05444141_1172 [Pseudovibrio denitrificans]|uniref:HEAT repeat-containing protein n=1 Tax=Pseudovibrio denitrificans TaxID=258256 RepID=A0A1I7E092_9HYPH|nr:hypothetical protein [Pseudovibrio denitrificans]SFU17348.1 hypothetical protein SAMN05444141_1172 [Pseudovibrio denitrificans]
MTQTAAEFLAELAKSKEYQATQEAKRIEVARLAKIYDADEKELVQELNEAGFDVQSVWDFVNTKEDYLGAEKILVKHLKQKHHPRIQSGVVRSLMVAEFSENDELWDLLIEMYAHTPSDEAIEVPEERGLQQAIAFTLECLAKPSRVDSLIRLVSRKPDGDAVSFLEETVLRLS